MKEKESEFGKGLSYCLGLFLAHAHANEKTLSADVWFNGASDHLYELQIPETLPAKLQKDLGTFQDRVLYFGHAFKDKAQEDDKTWAIEQAKELLRKVDKVYGVETQRAQWD